MNDANKSTLRDGVPNPTLVVANPFVRRQTAESPFSHYAGEGGWVTIIYRIKTALAVNAGAVRPGYRDGVILVDIDPTDIMSGVVTLTEGQELTGSFKARRAGEEPRKEVLAKGASKMPARSAFAVLYSSAVLAEDGDNDLPANGGGWELVSLNASPVEGEMPIAPHTLMHNHFGSDGGTATNMTEAEFVAALRTSFLWWKDKAMAG
jgi:hypothetical protein